MAHLFNVHKFQKPTTTRAQLLHVVNKIKSFDEMKKELPNMYRLLVTSNVDLNNYRINAGRNAINFFGDYLMKKVRSLWPAIIDPYFPAELIATSFRRGDESKDSFTHFMNRVVKVKLAQMYNVHRPQERKLPQDFVFGASIFNAIYHRWIADKRNYEVRTERNAEMKFDLNSRQYITEVKNDNMKWKILIDIPVLDLLFTARMSTLFRSYYDEIMRTGLAQNDSFTIESCQARIFTDEVKGNFNYDPDDFMMKSALAISRSTDRPEEVQEFLQIIFDEMENHQFDSAEDFALFLVACDDIFDPDSYIRIDSLLKMMDNLTTNTLSDRNYVVQFIFTCRAHVPRSMTTREMVRKRREAEKEFPRQQTRPRSKSVHIPQTLTYRMRSKSVGGLTGI